MNIIQQFFSTEQVKKSRCRWCNSLFEYSETNKPELPLMCWKCCDATLEKYAAAPPRIREKKPFVKL